MITPTALPAAASGTTPEEPPMPAPKIYLHLPGTAAEALEYYRGVFGGTVE